MKALYAVLVAIDNYSDVIQNLEGCKNDLVAIDSFLQVYCTYNNINYKPYHLLDKAATRKGIIAAFDHYQGANSSDLAFFFFSGHGSRINSPKEFWHIDLDTKCETIVCYDSRQNGDNDLLDKELAYLIWKATLNKGMHFLTIFDCCHGGSVTKNPFSRKRSLEDRSHSLPFKELMGRSHFTKINGKIYPPTGSHAALSASRNDESCIEMSIDGKQSGVFTYALLQALTYSNLQYLTYGMLISKVYAIVQSLSPFQHPQLATYGDFDANSLFLNGTLMPKPSQVLTYEAKNKNWIVDAGEIHGLRVNDKIHVKLQDNSIKSLKIREVQPGLSKIEPIPALTTSQSYECFASFRYQKKLKVAFSEANPPPVHFLKTLKNETKSQKIPIDWVDHSNQAEIWLHFKLNQLFISYPNSSISIYNSTKIKNPKQVDIALKLFLQNLKKIARWEALIHTDAISSFVNHSHLVEHDFFEVTNHQKFKKILNNGLRSFNPGEEKVLYYKKLSQKKVMPAFHLRIRSIAQIPIWIAGIYFAEDFSITDKYLRPLRLTPGAHPTMFSITYASGKETDIIPVGIPLDLQKLGVTSIRNHIKIFVSTQKFTTHQFNQTGLSLTNQMAKGIDLDDTNFLEQNTWTVIDIPFKVIIPQ